MKFMHLSDLHLGKRVNEFSMIEDQEYILKQILEIADREAVEVVLISGDVYDKPIPPVEAVRLLDQFLVDLGKRHLPVFLISGNHDSVQRLSFGNRLLAEGGLYIAPEYDGALESVPLEDEYGVIDVYMLPFVKPAHVRRFHPDEEIESYTDAMKAAVDAMNADFRQRNVLITHQFVTGAGRSESEELSVGGSDNVDGTVFEGFDYVALGHIHRPQNMESERIRYCGTPLKYSFSEAGHEKSVTVVELGAKTGEGACGELQIRTIPLTPKHDLREIRGTYLELTSRDYYLGTRTDDYLHITLTDEEDVPDAVGKLRIIYPNLMKLDYDNARTRASQSLTLADDVEHRSPLDLFGEFYQMQNNQEMNSQQCELMSQLIEKIWEGDA